MAGTDAGVTYTPLFPATAFREGRGVLATSVMAYVVEPDEPVVVPGVAPGVQATVIMRTTGKMTWFGGEILDLELDSSPVTITLGGKLPSGEELPPAFLTGLSDTTILASPSMFYVVIKESNQFRFHVGSTWPTRYAVDSSTNFVSWVPVLTNQTTKAFAIPFQDSGSVPLFFQLRRE